MPALPTLRTPAATAVAAAALLTGFLVVPALATSAGASPATAPSRSAPAAAALGTVSEDRVGDLVVENSFVSDQGWVKPGDTYPSRILLTNEGTAPVTGAGVLVTAPRGTEFVDARGGGGVVETATEVAWTPDPIAPGATVRLVLESQADTLAEEPTLVWRDLSTSAVLTVGGDDATVASHGPKVIPPGETYETAKYGDRPFPVVPVSYTDFEYRAHDRTLDEVINDPGYEGSTFNLFQEMSLGQLYPDGAVPSTGKGTVAYQAGEEGYDFTPRAIPGDTCTGGVTYADSPVSPIGTGLYPNRIDGDVYQLPGNRAFYGADSGGSAIAPVGQIDSGCGSPGKLVRDAAVISDPDIDFSDYDTDKDGVVDFFMAVFQGCGGNGASQAPPAVCEFADEPAGDNVWPHSSSLEFYYSDPDTGLPGYTTDDQLKDLEGRPLWYTDGTYSTMTTTPGTDALKVYVRVGPYNVNPETAIDKASVISHEYGHSLGLPDFYSSDGTRETYGDWNLMATDKSQNMDIFSRQELGWVVPRVLDEDTQADGWTDSKEDTDTITWETPAGDSYTLAEGADGRVQNSEAYVAKLPGRQLIDPAVFDSGDKASKTHAWWSQSGNDFGCAPQSGNNLDLYIPELATADPASTVKLEFKSLWDIEWDYDYGFVMTTTDGGANYTSHESVPGYTTENTAPGEGNPNLNACQEQYDHGITGTSGSYNEGTEAIDRLAAAPNYPAPVFLADEYDISDLAGEQTGALRFSYATDPGLARPGWFIDDVKVTLTEPGQAPREVLVTDFEDSGGPDDERVFNGGCREDRSTATKCTTGWSYVAAGAEAPADHAYYLEMRDRSGFDRDGNGQIDRTPIDFDAGLSMVYTDEAHGYGNNGVPDPPAQSPLDSQPVPGEQAPDLSDAAWTAADGDDTFSDFGDGHTDNYLDPESEGKDEEEQGDGNWHFRYDCLGFEVTDMSGQTEGPDGADGDLTGDVDFTVGDGCGEFDYGYVPETPEPPVDTVAPRARMSVSPLSPFTTQRVTLSARGTTDNVSAPGRLRYQWDFGNGGRTVDATGAIVRTRFGSAGPRSVRLTVTDQAGNRRTVGRPVTVRRFAQCFTREVGLRGSWRSVSSRYANGGRYCDNLGRGRGADTATFTFRGPSVTVVRGVSRRGGLARVFIDGRRVSNLSFRSATRAVRFTTKGYGGFGEGRHTVRIVVQRGQAYLDGFVVRR